MADSRSLRAAPTAWVRGTDGGKLIKGVKVFAVCDKHGSLLDLELQPANTDDRAGILPTLPRLAALGFEGDLLGDSGFKGAPFATAPLEHDIHVAVAVSPAGMRDGRSWQCPEPCRTASHRSAFMLTGVTLCVVRSRHTVGTTGPDLRAIPASKRSGLLLAGIRWVVGPS